MPKAKKKKVNPRRKPATWADVEKAHHEIDAAAMRHAIELVLYLLVDKHGAPKEDVKELNREISYTAELINENKLSWTYIEKVLRENELEVRLR